jgi:propionyl-CoA carboxylase beta chain
VRGGSSEATTTRRTRTGNAGSEYGLPLVRLLDGTVAVDPWPRSKIGATYVPFVPGIDQALANLSRAPVVARLGRSPGWAHAGASHYSVMVAASARCSTAGPPVEGGGEKVTAEQLGGADLHAGTGSVDDTVDTEQEAFARVRKFLSYLPSRAGERSTRLDCTDPPDRTETWLDSAIPRDRRWPYDIRPILEAVLDRGSF